MDNALNYTTATINYCITIDTSVPAALPALSVQQSGLINGKTNIAVAEFTGRNVSQSDALIVSDFLRTELVNLNVYNIVEKANMDKILAEASFQMTGCTTADCVVQLGKILNVREMVIGSLAKLTDTYYITVNIVDVETGKILASFDQDAPAEKDLKNACHLIAGKMSDYK
jgi:curli biogenesis system outer membrane secretion channel CsgG